MARKSKKKGKSRRKSKTKRRNVNKRRKRTQTVAKKRRSGGKRAIVGGKLKDGFAGVGLGETVQDITASVGGSEGMGMVAGAGGAYAAGKTWGLLGYVVKKLVTGGLNLGGLGFQRGGGGL